MTSDIPSSAEPANLRLLRRLVMLLLLTMIVCGATISVFFIKKMTPRALPLPAAITLPEDTQAISITYGPDFYGVVTENRMFLIFDSATGALKQRIEIK